MKKNLLIVASAAALGVIAYAAGTEPKVLPRTVQGIDYASTLPAAAEKAPAVAPLSDYPSDPGDLGVPQGDFTFDMIESWSGEGANRAALVIQWNDNREKNALVFGYRWDGQATGADMIRAVVADNPRLYGLIQYTNVSSPTDPNGGYTINGFGWDLDDDGEISLKDEGNGQIYTSETGLFIHPRGYVPGQGGSSDYDYDNWKATDADDLWAAGWYTNGYWSYWVKEGAAGSFGYSGWGASGRLLSDGSWDGWNFSVGFGSYDWKPFVAAPAGIPDDAKTLFKHDGIYYSLKSYSSKTVLVCAPAEMEGETLTSYSGDIVIPASFTDEETEYKVVGIADAAFAATEVTGITLPESVTEIGADAFSATPLATVKFAGEGSADQLRTIGDRAFCATAITEPIFPANVKNLGAGVFASTQIAEVVLPEGIVSVGEMCFADNAALTKVVIPQSVKTIASGAFAECPAIAEVKVENTVAPACSDDVFDAAVYAAATLTVPVGYTGVYGAAEGWKNFTKTAEYAMDVNVGDLFDMDGISYRVTAVGETNEVALTYKRVEGTVSDTRIEAANLAGWKGVVTVAPVVSYQNISFKVTSMTENTFRGAKELTEVTLPEGITEIPQYSFDECEALVKVVLPSTVSSLGMYSFSNCTSLVSMQLPEGLKTIGDRAFFYSEALESINLPASLTELGASAFSYCTGLKSIDLPQTIEKIGSNAFQNCRSLTEVKIPASLTEIPQSMFSSCAGLTSVTIPSTVTAIGSSAFQSCSSLTEITLPAALTELGSSTFQGCSSLTEVAIPAGVTTLPMSLFYNCSSLRKVTMNPDAVFGGTQVFRSCRSLETLAYYGDDDIPAAGTIKLGANMTTLPNYTFNGCVAMKSIILPAGLTAVSQYSLADNGLTAIDLPDGVKTIQGWAFRNPAFSELVIPASVTTMSQNYICQNATEMTIYMCNPTPISIGSYTMSLKGSSGPYAKVVVPTATADAYMSTGNNWKKSEITAPEIAGVEVAVTGVEVLGDKHIVSGCVNVSYDKAGLPGRFLAANNAWVLPVLAIAFEVETPARSTAAGTITPAADGTFTAEIEGLAPATTYGISFAATHGDNSYEVAPGTFTTPATTGIGSLEVGDSTVADVYSVSGVRVATGVSVSEARATLPAGVYVLRSEGKTAKIVIR